MGGSQICYDVPGLLQLFESWAKTATSGSCSVPWGSSRSDSFALPGAMPQVSQRYCAPASSRYVRPGICGSMWLGPTG